MIIKDWNIEGMTGYKPITTFYQDFSIADKFGIDAIKDTYNRAFNEWKNDYKYLTELSMALNWKIAEHYKDNGTEQDNKIALLYNDLWRQTDNYALDNLKGEQRDYYIQTTD